MSDNFLLFLFFLINVALIVHEYRIYKLEKQIAQHFSGIYAILHKKFNISAEEIAENLREYAESDIDFVKKEEQ